MAYKKMRGLSHLIRGLVDSHHMIRKRVTYSTNLITSPSCYFGRNFTDLRRGSHSSLDMDGPRTCFLIGVAGGTASGKSTVCQKIMEQLGQAEVSDSQRKVACIAQDSFYRQLTEAESIKANKGLFDFDHPNALDIDLIVKTLQDVLNGRKAEVPVYDYVTNSRKKGEFTTIYPADVVLFEGILAFYFAQVRDLFHMKLFVDTDPDTRLSRRVMRDVQERGRDLDNVLSQYMRFVKPAFEEFCLPSKKFADVIVPRGADNLVAISLIVQHIQDLLASRRIPVPSSIAASPHEQQFQQQSTQQQQQQGQTTTTSSQQSIKRRLAKELSRPH